MPIKGIKVQLETGSDWWSDSSDALFLALYGKNGGREFRLNKGLSIGPDSNLLSLVLGDACCESDDDIQVPDSINYSQDNSPYINPIELNDVERVYLRKATATGSGTSDDWLTINSAEVLLCDHTGGMRRFEKTGELNFSDETGLKHWLMEIAPPYCNVLVRFKHVHQIEAAGKDNVGKVWRLNFGADPDNASAYDIFSSVQHRIWPWQTDLAREWTKPILWAKNYKIIGCCGSKVSMEFVAKAIEIDHRKPFKPDYDDVGYAKKRVEFKCTPEPITTSHEIKFDMFDDSNSNRQSHMTFAFEIDAHCMA